MTPRPNVSWAPGGAQLPFSKEPFLTTSRTELRVRTSGGPNSESSTLDLRPQWPRHCSHSTRCANDASALQPEPTAAHGHAVTQMDFDVGHEARMATALQPQQESSLPGLAPATTAHFGPWSPKEARELGPPEVLILNTRHKPPSREARGVGRPHSRNSAMPLQPPPWPPPLQALGLLAHPETNGVFSTGKARQLCSRPGNE